MLMFFLKSGAKLTSYYQLSKRLPRVQADFMLQDKKDARKQMFIPQAVKL